MNIIKGIKFDDIEAPLKRALFSLANSFNIERENKIINAGNLELSFGFIDTSYSRKKPIATIKVNKVGYQNRVSNDSYYVPNSGNFYSLHHFLNEPEMVVDEILKGWKKFREENPAVCNKAGNFVHLEPFPFDAIGYSHVNKISQLIKDMNGVNISRITMPGLSRTFDDFYNVYVADNRRDNKIIGMNRNSPEDKKHVVNMFNDLYKGNGLSLINASSRGSIYHFENFLADNLFRDSIDSLIIEQFYVDAAKNAKYAEKELYLSAKKFIEPENFKTKLLKGWHEIYAMGDSDNFFCEELPSNLDSFFLSKKFVETNFLFHVSGISKDKLVYTNNQYTQNLKTFFNIMSDPALQSLSGVKSASVTDIGGIWNCTLEVKSNYNRQDCQKFATQLLGSLINISKNNPFASKEIEKFIYPDRKNGMVVYRDRKIYMNLIKEWADTLKLKNKVQKNLDKIDVIQDTEDNSSDMGVTFKM